MPRPFRPAAGFTLVEVLIVVLVMGVVAGAVIPLLNPSVHERLQSVAQLVSDDLAYARSLAVTNNSRYRLTFDVGNNLYYLEHSGANSLLNTLPTSSVKSYNDPATRQTTKIAFLPPSSGYVKLHAVGSNVAPQSPRAELEFRSFGETTQTTETVVWLSSNVGASPRYLSITVNPITGLALGAFTAIAPPASLLSGS